MQEISEELCEAIGESSGVGSKLAELREAGYSLNLLLDCKKLEDLQDAVASDEEQTGNGVRRPLAQLSAGPAGSASDDEGPPRFRINADDLAFLRSVGIDPTRRRPRRPRRDDRHRTVDRDEPDESGPARGLLSAGNTDAEAHKPPGRSGEESG